MASNECDPNEESPHCLGARDEESPPYSRATSPQKLAASLGFFACASPMPAPFKRLQEWLTAAPHRTLVCTDTTQHLGLPHGRTGLIIRLAAKEGEDVVASGVGTSIADGNPHTSYRLALCRLAEELRIWNTDSHVHEMTTEPYIRNDAALLVEILECTQCEITVVRLRGNAAARCTNCARYFCSACAPSYMCGPDQCRICPEPPHLPASRYDWMRNVESYTKESGKLLRLIAENGVAGQTDQIRVQLQRVLNHPCIGEFPEAAPGEL